MVTSTTKGVWYVTPLGTFVTITSDIVIQCVEFDFFTAGNGILTDW